VVNLTMSSDEREAYLADLHVGVMSVERSDGPPLTVPVWYDYRPGAELWVVTDGLSVKGRLLRLAGRFSLCAQSETPPYSYVSVEGPCRVEASDLEQHLRPMARRYLGPELGDSYTDNAPHGTEPIVVFMRPERWFTVDFGKLEASGSS
jgi:nitroimidazol reductase NimA-like FMN-containing flavoprotein (pyridoxamine 5'-phosphate oxidase superfamily)